MKKNKLYKTFFYYHYNIKHIISIYIIIMLLHHSYKDTVELKVIMKKQSIVEIYINSVCKH